MTDGDSASDISFSLSVIPVFIVLIYDDLFILVIRASPVCGKRFQAYDN